MLPRQHTSLVSKRGPDSTIISKASKPTEYKCSYHILPKHAQKTKVFYAGGDSEIASKKQKKRKRNLLRDTNTRRYLISFQPVETQIYLTYDDDDDGCVYSVLSICQSSMSITCPAGSWVQDLLLLHLSWPSLSQSFVQCLVQG